MISVDDAFKELDTQLRIVVAMLHDEDYQSRMLECTEYYHLRNLIREYKLTHLKEYE